jgi:DNA-binding response OmpR family regulator
MLNNRIVIADDEPHILLSLKYVVGKMGGFQVFPAENGDEALKLIQSELPKLVILDVMMPKISGFDVCEKIKNDNNLKDIYVILLTAKGQETDKEKGLMVGADEYFTKPFDPDKLLSKIKTIMA